MKIPFIQRRDGHTYLMNVIVMSIVTVILTRIYLQLTNYPQIAGNGLHIAHMLWGGLFLLVGVVMLFLYKGKVIKEISSIFAGVGWGLFIDELGKFITSDNNYHYRPTAPLIYIIFLIIIMVFLYIQRKKVVDTKTKMFEVLEDLEEIVRGDLDKEEKKIIEKDLKHIISKDKDPNIQKLAISLLEYVKEQSITGSKEKDFSFAYKIGRKLKTFLDILLPRKLFVHSLVVLLIIRTLICIPIIYFTLFLHGTVLTNSIDNIAFASITTVQLIFCIYFCFSLIQFLKGSRKHLRFSIKLLVFSILILDVFIAYYTQFLVVTNVIADFTLYVIFRSLQSTSSQSETVID